MANSLYHCLKRTYKGLIDTNKGAEMANGKFIAYYRVSTQKQGRSGLGLEAQKEAVVTYLNGGRWQLLKEFTEVESGKRHENRPQLQAALAACRATGAQLVVAKLDRLARNVAFISALMEAGVDFVAVDFPQANRLTIHVLAAVAEHEAQAISSRTKAALAAAKARGVTLGNPDNATAEGRAKGIAAAEPAWKSKADRFAADCRAIIDELRSEGLSLNQTAARLNADNILSPRGIAGAWTPTAVSRVIMRNGR